MRCSSLWTVLLSSSTTESVMGAIVPGCGGDDVQVCVRVRGVGGLVRGEAQWQSLENDEDGAWG
jgi:hypothetical protein